MRYRAWDVDDSIMYEDVIPMYIEGELINLILEWENTGYDFSEVELKLYDTTYIYRDEEFPYYIMEYTGEYDKEGKELCESDYVILDKIKNKKFEVVKDGRNFQLKEVGGELTLKIDYLHENTDFEIIGNKYVKTVG